MDCQMPELTGYEATAAIRASERSGSDTPIIAMTAGARREDRERCLDAGMNAYLAKPVNQDALLALVAQAVQQGPDMTEALRDVDTEAVATITRVPDPFAEASHPALDADVIGRLERLGESTGEDLMGQLTVLFVDDANALVAALHQGLDADDPAAVVRAAHSLSGASANLGAVDLSHLCATLASDGAAGHLARGRVLLAAIETELARVCSALPLPRQAP
jgi:two-component system sensor histidine kinase/response regulator